MKERRDQRFRAYLEPLLRPWLWSETVPPEVNARARRDLIEFTHRVKCLLPKAKIYRDEPLSPRSNGHSYIRQLLKVRQELERQRFDLACHELMNVVHFFCVSDRRVLYTILKQVEEFL